MAMNIDESRKMTIKNAIAQIDEEMRFCRALRKTLSELKQELTRELFPEDALKRAALSEGINGHERMEKFLEWAEDQINRAVQENIKAAWEVAYAKGKSDGLKTMHKLEIEHDRPTEILKEACRVEFAKLNLDEPIGDDQLESMYDEQTELED